MNITLTLNVDQANLILNALGQLPYVQSADLIVEISKQAREQVAQQQQQQPKEGNDGSD